MLDANVLVSAVLKSAGVPGQILDEWRAERFALLESAPIPEEIARVLDYPRIARLHRWPRGKVQEFVAEFAYAAVLTPGEMTLNVIRSDPDDNRYLECAVEGDADYVVSGDQNLLELQEYQGIRVVSPKAFLQAGRPPDVDALDAGEKPSEAVAEVEAAPRAYLRLNSNPALPVSQGSRRPADRFPEYPGKSARPVSAPPADGTAVSRAGLSGGTRSD